MARRLRLTTFGEGFGERTRRMTSGGRPEQKQGPDRKGLGPEEWRNALIRLRPAQRDRVSFIYVSGPRRHPQRGPP